MKSYIGMEVCFICLEPKGILINKRLRNTLEDKMITNMEPCDKCKKHMKRGIILVRTDKSSKQFNGTYMVIKKQAVKNIFKGWKDLDLAIKRRVIIVEDTVFDLLHEKYSKKGEQDDNK